MKKEDIKEVKKEDLPKEEKKVEPAPAPKPAAPAVESKDYKKRRGLDN